MSSIRSTVARLFDGHRIDLPDAPEADFVLAPRSADVIARLLDVASEHRLTVLPWGAGLHQGMGGRVDPDIVLSTSRLNAVVDWRPDDLTVVVEPGVTVSDLEEQLDARGQTAVLSDASPGATVGGVVAAGVSGYRRHRYGPTRDRVLEVVLATGDGRLATAGGQVVKNVTGYDVPRLVCGSFGALGVVTRLCLKLWPQGSSEATIPVPDAEAALEHTFRPLAVLEVDGTASVMVSGAADELESFSVALGSPGAHGIKWPTVPEGDVVVSVRVPPSDLRRAVGKLPNNSRYVAQFGVGEVTVAVAMADLPGLTELRGWVEDRGGSLVLLHADDQLRSQFDPWGAPPSSLPLQRRVKAAFDPVGVMVPGRLPGGL